MNGRTVVLVLLLLASTAAAPPQNKTGENSTGSPTLRSEPLQDDFLNWMMGKWTGVTIFESGRSRDRMSCETGVGGQFLILRYASEGFMGDYRGTAAFTQTEEGRIEAVWIDNFRDIARGAGRREGDLLSMEWESRMGKGTRIITRVDGRTLAMKSRWETTNGLVIESRSEFRRQEP